MSPPHPPDSWQQSPASSAHRSTAPLPSRPPLWHRLNMLAKDRLTTLSAFIASLAPPKRPPIVVPDADCAGADAIFRHVDPAAIPEVATALEWLMEHRPDVIAAVADVDRTLIWDAMERTPLENLRLAESLAGDEDDLRAALRHVA